MQSDDDNFWFHAKTFGWGWGLPARWQGWVVLLVYVAAVGVALGTLDVQRGLAVIVLLTVLFITVVAFKGERPLKWRWGRDDNDSER